jgi:hypothetical protein
MPDDKKLKLSDIGERAKAHAASGVSTASRTQCGSSSAPQSAQARIPGQTSHYNIEFLDSMKVSDNVQYTSCVESECNLNCIFTHQSGQRAARCSVH